MNVPFNKLQCAQCRNWGGNFNAKCNATDTRKYRSISSYNPIGVIYTIHILIFKLEFGYSDSSVYCFYAFNNLPNYVPLNYTITTIYGSGAQSSPYSYGAPIYLSR